MQARHRATAFLAEGGSRFRHSPWVAIAVVLTLIGGVVALLYPVLAAPVGADDRYWYLQVPGRTHGSYVEATTWTLNGIVDEPATGRVATLAFLLRRFNALIVTDLAVATSTPIVVFQAVMKFVVLILVVLTCLAFLRSIRLLSRRNETISLSTRSVILVTVSTAVILAVGAQAHSQFRNGWTSYALLTYTAVIAILGIPTFILWLTRMFAKRGLVSKVGVLVLAIVVAVGLNFTYELYFVAVPVSVLVLLLQVIDLDVAVARRAKLFVGGTFLASFAGVFLAIRVWISNACSANDCYVGTHMDLSPAVLRTFIANFLTAVPGAARSELRDDLVMAGREDNMPGILSPIPLLIAAAVAAGFLYVWWRLTDTSHASVRMNGSQDVKHRESMILLKMATIPFTAALGSALVMALSEQAQEVIEGIGEPYRNTMATWTLLALTASMLVRAATLRWSRRRSVALLVCVAAAITLLGGHALTTNLSALAASRSVPDTVISETIQWETVLGDMSTAGDARRCASFDALMQMRNERVRDALRSSADAAFLHYHGRYYCSRYAPDPR